MRIRRRRCRLAIRGLGRRADGWRHRHRWGGWQRRSALADWRRTTCQGWTTWNNVRNVPGHAWTRRSRDTSDGTDWRSVSGIDRGRGGHWGRTSDDRRCTAYHRRGPLHDRRSRTSYAWRANSDRRCAPCDRRRTRNQRRRTRNQRRRSHRHRRRSHRERWSCPWHQQRAAAHGARGLLAAHRGVNLGQGATARTIELNHTHNLYPSRAPSPRELCFLARPPRVVAGQPRERTAVRAAGWPLQVAAPCGGRGRMPQWTRLDSRTGQARALPCADTTDDAPTNYEHSRSSAAIRVPPQAAS